MPPRDPKSFAPVVELDEAEKYRLRLDEYEEGPSQFKTKIKNALMLTYKFNVHHMDGTPVIDESTGEIFQIWHFTNDSTRPSKPPYVGSRELASALIGRALDDDDIRSMIPVWEETLIGKTAIADLSKVFDRDTGEFKRWGIVRLLPDRARKAPEPVNIPQGVPSETPAQRRARLEAELAAAEEEDTAI